MQYATTLILAATAILSGVEAAIETVTFNSSGTQMVGIHHSPNSTTLAPVILIAHGFAGLQTSRLQPFAQAFADNGYHALTFDYRYWGASAGKPRNIIDVASQQADYQAAMAAAQALPGVDASRVIFWGTSLSGGHVLELGVKVPSLVAVIAQAPHTNGIATISQIPANTLPALTAAGLSDQTAGLVAPVYIPVANHTGEFGALTQAGAYEGYQFVQPNPPPPGNVFPARFVLQLPFFSPNETAYKSTVPTFIGACLTDNIVTPEPAIALAKKMNATLHTYDGGHFSVYPGADQYAPILTDQLAFLRKYVPL